MDHEFYGSWILVKIIVNIMGMYRQVHIFNFKFQVFVLRFVKYLFSSILVSVSWASPWREVPFRFSFGKQTKSNLTVRGMFYQTPLLLKGVISSQMKQMEGKKWHWASLFEEGKILQIIKTKSYITTWLFTLHKEVGQNKEWYFRNFRRTCDTMPYMNYFKYTFNTSFPSSKN